MLFCLRIGIFGLTSIKKHRYENNRGHLNTQNTVRQDMTSKMKKDAKSEITMNSEDLDDDDMMVLKWSRQNRDFAKELEADMKIRFEQVIRTLDVFEIDEKLNDLSYANSIGNLNLHLLNFGSNSTIAESLPESIAESTPSEPISDKRIDRLKKLNPAAFKSVNRNETANAKNDPKKKMVCIPSGYECDLVNFFKYNPM